MLASGTDSEGNALAAGSLARDKIKDMEPVTLDNIFLEKAVFDVKADGGCAVVKADFPASASLFFEKAEKMCREWLDVPVPEDEAFSLLLSPYLLNGSVYVLFLNLVFAYGHEKPDGGRCLILAFDNTATIPYETGDVDYAAIVREVEAEMKRRETELAEELDDAKEEEDAARDAGAYDFGKEIADRYDPEHLESRGNPVDKGRVRSGRQGRGIRIARRDEDA